MCTPGEIRIPVWSRTDPVDSPFKRGPLAKTVAPDFSRKAASDPVGVLGEGRALNFKVSPYSEDEIALPQFA